MMSDNICFDRKSFMVGILIMVLVVYGVTRRVPCTGPKILNVSELVTASMMGIERRLHERAAANRQQAHTPSVIPVEDPVVERDRAVLKDPIYPPLARTERPIFDHLLRESRDSNLNVPTRGSEDTFRPLAYLINTNKAKPDMGGDVWMLFGRQTFRGSSRGEFFASPVNDKRADMKVPLKDDMMVGEKVRDIYALPPSVTFKSPFFSDESYTVSELPKPDLTSRYL
jgi:hypothetical protein